MVLALRRFFLVIIAVIEFGSAARAEPALWKVEGGTAHVWLFGTYHLLPANAQWRDAALDDVLAKADTLYLEAPIDDIEQGDVIEFLQQNGYYEPDEELWSALDEGQARRLQALGDSLGLPAYILGRMRPWLVNVTLTDRMAETKGYSSAYGADITLADAAKKLGKTIAYFETVEDQLTFLSSEAEEQQLKELDLTIEQFETMPDIFDRFFSAWQSGNVDELSALISEGGDEVPEYWKIMVSNRNAAWAETLDELLQRESDVLVAVGAGHLVGDGSLIDLLESKGYAVKRQ